MKKIIFLVAITVLSLGSCKKSIIIRVSENESIISKNYVVLTPGIGLFGNSSETEARFIIEDTDLLNRFNLKITFDDKGKAIISKPTANGKKEIDVPITNISISYFLMKEESQGHIQDSYPLSDYLEKIELFIHKTDKTVETIHSQYNNDSQENILLASYTDIASSPTSTGSNLLITAYEFNLTEHNFTGFILSGSNYYFEIVGTFKDVPETPRFFSFDLNISFVGLFEK